MEQMPRDGIQRITLEGPPPAAELPDIEVIQNPERHAAVPHPNGAVRLERLYIAVEDLPSAIDLYRSALGLPAPKMERGTVIMADMAVFDLGPGLTLASPYAPGPCADALKARGPGFPSTAYRLRLAASAIPGNMQCWFRPMLATLISPSSATPKLALRGWRHILDMYNI
ncbi:MAG: hypothetical protein ACT4P4_22615 [Betaproteobacteria bacterium]